VTQETALQAITFGTGAATLRIDTSIYAIPVALRACYKFTDRAYVFVAREGATRGMLLVTLAAKALGTQPSVLIGDLANELIDQRLRQDIADETAPLRELIVAQAFAEGNLFDVQRDDGDYLRDPLGVGKPR